MLSPGFVEIAADLNITVNTLSQATAWVILLIGLSLFIFNPIAKKVGRRPVYAISSIISTMSPVSYFPIGQSLDFFLLQSTRKPCKSFPYKGNY
jgi:MFS family permease